MFNISIKLHFTFILFLLLLIVSGVIRKGFPGLAMPLFFTCMFLTVVLHELGHSLMAKRYKIKVKDITLFFIGGIAKLERFPEKSNQEILIAFAGPSVSIFVAFFFWGVLFLFKDVMGGSTSLPYRFFHSLAVLNLILAIFNLLPAFPMDGGRILRAVLSKKFDYAVATNIAAWIGKLIAIGFAVFGIMFYPWLIFIAFFIYFGAEAESKEVILKSVIKNIPGSTVMISDVESFEASKKLREILPHVYRSAHSNFLVVDPDGRIKGILTRSDILNSLNKKLDAPIDEVYRKDFLVVSPEDPLHEVYEKMKAHNFTVVGVGEGDRFYGIITLENINKFFTFKFAMKTKGVKK